MGSGSKEGGNFGDSRGASAIWGDPGKARRCFAEDHAALSVWGGRQDRLGRTMDELDHARGCGGGGALRAREWNGARGGERGFTAAGAQPRFYEGTGESDSSSCILPSP